MREEARYAVAYLPRHIMNCSPLSLALWHADTMQQTPTTTISEVSLRWKSMATMLDNPIKARRPVRLGCPGTKVATGSFYASPRGPGRSLVILLTREPNTTSRHPLMRDLLGCGSADQGAVLERIQRGCVLPLGWRYRDNHGRSSLFRVQEMLPQHHGQGR